MLLEFYSTTPNIQELPIPCFQELVRIVGSLDDIHAKLEELKKGESAELLEIEFRFETDKAHSFREALISIGARQLSIDMIPNGPDQ